MNTQSLARPHYQLTRHPIGSIREIWAVSWPLMLGLLSASLMFFSDRLILAHYSLDCMNGAASGGMASYAAMILPIVIAETTEIFVGKLNGEGALQKVARPCWQMLWLALLFTPLYWGLANPLATLLFDSTTHTNYSAFYFAYICYFAPCFIASVALAGFFIGTGKVKVVTYTMIGANIVNIAFDFLLIWGSKNTLGISFIPELGIRGAAIATGISQAFQVLVYLALFLCKENRQAYGTKVWQFNWSMMKEFLQVALPSSVGRVSEMVAHSLFFGMMQQVSYEAMTIATIVQTLYIVTAFIIDGIKQGSAAILSNLIGAKVFSPITKALKAACQLHVLISLCLTLILACFTKPITAIFFPDEARHLLENAQFFHILQTACLWMSLFFLVDGLAWIFFSLFASSGDTKFVMYVTSSLAWLGYVLPLFALSKAEWLHADSAWSVIAINNAFILGLYYIRYRTKYAPQFTESTPLVTQLS